MYECKVSGSSDWDTIDEDCYECKVSESSDEDTMEEDCYECKVGELIKGVTVILLFAYWVTILITLNIPNKSNVQF